MEGTILVAIPTGLENDTNVKKWLCSQFIAFRKNQGEHTGK